jgi:hypothetical protein
MGMQSATQPVTRITKPCHGHKAANPCPGGADSNGSASHFPFDSGTDQSHNNVEKTELLLDAVLSRRCWLIGGGAMDAGR